MPCFIGQNSITCYRDAPDDIESKIKTKCDGKVYLSRYPSKMFKSMKPDVVIELYYRRTSGEWGIKKFLKSYLEFVSDIDDLHDVHDLMYGTIPKTDSKPNTASPVSMEVS
jgi:hypothetical protein